MRPDALRREEERGVAQEAARRPSTASPPASSQPGPPPARLSWREKQELQQLEEQIAGLEAEKQRLGEEINLSGEDYLRLQELVDTLAAKEAALEQAMSRWLELAARAEEN